MNGDAFLPHKAHAGAVQTVGKPLKTILDLQGGSVKGDGESPFTFNLLEFTI